MAHYKLDLMSAQCVACDLHKTVYWTLKHMCLRQLTEQWGNRKSRILSKIRNVLSTCEISEQIQPFSLQTLQKGFWSLTLLDVKSALWLLWLEGKVPRVPDKNGVSQAWYSVEIHHCGWKTSKCKSKLTLLWFLQNSTDLKLSDLRKQSPDRVKMYSPHSTASTGPIMAEDHCCIIYNSIKAPAWDSMNTNKNILLCKSTSAFC